MFTSFLHLAEPERIQERTGAKNENIHKKPKNDEIQRLKQELSGINQQNNDLIVQKRQLSKEINIVKKQTDETINYLQQEKNKLKKEVKQKIDELQYKIKDQHEQLDGRYYGFNELLSMYYKDVDHMNELISKYLSKSTDNSSSKENENGVVTDIVKDEKEKMSFF